MSTDPLPVSLLGPATKADAVYSELRSRIIEARLAPGERLDQETLATSLGVSTTPLREALRRLEAERLVQRAAHREVVISPLTRAELAELYQVRAEVDVLAVRLAAQAHRPADIAEARAVLDRTSPEEPYTRLRENRAFHRSLYSACHNGVLVETLDWLWDRSDRYRYVLLEDRQKLATARREHARILSAIASGDADRAAELMRRHLRESAASIDALLPDGGYGANA